MTLNELLPEIIKEIAQDRGDWRVVVATLPTSEEGIALGDEKKWITFDFSRSDGGELSKVEAFIFPPRMGKGVENG